MENKTCGDCKYYEVSTCYFGGFRCLKGKDIAVSAFLTNACNKFKQKKWGE